MINVRVGILDTGLKLSNVSESACFLDTSQSDVKAPTEREHGSQLGLIVRSQANEASLLDARAFVAGQPSSAQRIAEAIDWLVQREVNIINMSFGLQNNRPVLATAIANALQAGVVCVASKPAQGAPVFPASYAGVVAVSGDARCSADEFSLLHAAPDWHFGAANGGPNHHAHERGLGASFACAHVSGKLAKLLDSGCPRDELQHQLAQSCGWTGRECRR